MADIGVVIPTYNSSSYVIEAIDSVLKQTVLPQKIVVVDDGSVDNTKTLIQQKYKNQKRVVYCYQENAGLSAARNTGIRQLDNTYIALLDSDDLWLPTKLEKQLLLFKDIRNLGLVYTNYRLIDQSGNNIEKSTATINPQMKGDVYQKLKQKNQILGSGSAVLVKKECFEKVGLFDENLSAAEDWDMWLRISKKYLVDYVPQVLVKLRRHRDNMQTDHTRIFTNTIQVYTKYLINEEIDPNGVAHIQRLLFKSMQQHNFNPQKTQKLLATIDPDLQRILFQDKIQLIRNIGNVTFDSIKSKILPQS